VGVVVRPSFARSTTYSTPDEAAQAGFEQFWHPVIGSCEGAVATPAQDEMCFTRQPANGYYLYYGGPAGIADLSW